MTSVNQRNYLLKIVIILSIVAIFVSLLTTVVRAEENENATYWKHLTYVFTNPDSTLTQRGYKDARVDLFVEVPKGQTLRYDSGVLSIRYSDGTYQMNVNGYTYNINSVFGSNFYPTANEWVNYTALNGMRVMYKCTNSPSNVQFAGLARSDFGVWQGLNDDITYDSFEEYQARQLPSPVLERVVPQETESHNNVGIFDTPLETSYYWFCFNDYQYSTNINAIGGVGKLYYLDLEGNEKFITFNYKPINSISDSGLSVPYWLNSPDSINYFYWANDIGNFNNALAESNRQLATNRMICVPIKALASQLPVNSVVNKIELSVHYQFSGFATPTTTLVYDIASNSLITNDIFYQGQPTSGQLITGSNSNTGVLVNNPNNIESLQGIIDWVVNGFSTVVTSLSRLFSSLMQLLSTTTGFINYIGSIMQIVLGSELGQLITLAKILYY